MRVYTSKHNLLPGSSYEEVISIVRKEHKKIAALTKRQPYIRSAYFNKDKIFISLFLDHIMQKNRKIRTRRLKLYMAAIDLLRNTREEPETIFSKSKMSILLHRFYGKTKEGIEFCVQVKQDKRTGRKDFMSVFARKIS